MARRPEHIAPPEIFYNDVEAHKYSQNTRIIQIQKELSERAIDILGINCDEGGLVLDIGCGSGLSGEVLTEQGFQWIGVDISAAMLDVAKSREVEGGLLLCDIGDGLPFRAGTFDAAVSISAVQWLFVASKSHQNPIRRIRTFFTSLYACMKRGAKVVLQYYPETPQQDQILQTEAIRAGFTAALLIDNPEGALAKKYFLILGVGVPVEPPQDRGCEIVARQQRQRRERPPAKNSKAWILKKKEKATKMDRTVAADSKYTGRKRRPKF